MKSASEIVNELHAEYCARTGLEIGLNYIRERQWAEWQRYCSSKPFTLDDLKLVIAFIRHGIRNRERNDGAFRFTNLIAQPDRFEEDLAAARQWRAASGPRRPRSGATSTAAAAPVPPPMTDAEREEMKRELAERHPRRRPLES